MSTRLKGQAVEVLISSGNKPLTNLTNIKDFEVTVQQEILSEGYLGQTTEQKDSIFNGIAGNLTIHIDNQDVFKFVSEIVDKARSRTPGLKVNIKATLNFPNGQRPRIMINDVEFGDIPLNFGSRKDYGSVKLTFEASNFSYLY